jgi:CO dehydrogenase/acetyl-CoA synthase beta subunit
MRLYNNLIDEIKSSLTNSNKLNKSNIELNVSNKNSVIFMSDAAFELGGNNKPCVSSLAVSSNLEFSNSVFLQGNDLDKIKSDSPFGKFIFIQVENFPDEQDTFNKIKELEALRYHLSVDGFMTRASALNMREQIRVSKKALKSGVTFSDYGYALLKEYLKFPYVKSVEIFFVTDSDNFEVLNSVAKKISQTTSALNHIFDNVMFDCSSCNLKEICDEVDGLKELHLKNIKSE